MTIPDKSRSGNQNIIHNQVHGHIQLYIEMLCFDRFEKS